MTDNGKAGLYPAILAVQAAAKTLPKNARLSYSTHHATDVINDRNWDTIERLQAFASQSGRGMLEVAFGWLLAKPITASVIAGASTPEQIELNVRAGATKLTAGEVAELDRLTQ